MCVKGECDCGRCRNCKKKQIIKQIQDALVPDILKTAAASLLILRGK